MDTDPILSAGESIAGVVSSQWKKYEQAKAERPEVQAERLNLALQKIEERLRGISPQIQFRMTCAVPPISEIGFLRTTSRGHSHWKLWFDVNVPGAEMQVLDLSGLSLELKAAAAGHIESFVTQYLQEHKSRTSELKEGIRAAEAALKLLEGA